MKNAISILVGLSVMVFFAGCAADDEDSGAPSTEETVTVSYLIDNFSADDADPLCDMINGNDGENVGSWFAWIDADAAGTAITPSDASQMCDATKATGGAKDDGAYLAITGKSGGNGIGVGAYFNLVGTSMEVVDFSAHSGLVFWAKGKANVRVSLNMPALIPVALGGTCDEANAAEGCYNYHGADVKVDSQDWAQYSLAWSTFAQLDWGNTPLAFDPAKIASIHFQFGGENNKDVILDLDEVAFYTK